MEVYRRELSANMFVINTGGYDIILGMTWRSKYHAVIDYRNKSVIFKISHQLEFQFDGKSKVSRQMQQGDRATTEVQEKSILVAEKFFDVFPKDLPGLLPNRDIEFCIDVISGTIPIFNAPYQMAPMELVELKK